MTAPLGARPLYSQCWEDLDVARAALRVRPGDTVLVVAAAGDNAIGLLQDDPARVLAIDVNPAQTALVGLKIAASQRLAPSALGPFLGVSPAVDRASTYDALRRTLGAADQARWDANVDAIERGVIHVGRFERYLEAFRRAILPLAPGRGIVRAMLSAADLGDQRRIYRERWDSRRWRLLFRVFFSRGLLRRFGRDPAFFAQCEIDRIGDHYLARAAHALTALPIRSNPYLTYMLAGRFGSDEQTPDYLRPSVLETIRQRLGRVGVETASVDEVLRDLPARSVDAFDLSDIFELATPAEHEATLAEVARVGKPGARICYWNNLVPRQRPPSLARHIDTHPAEAASMHARDRAFLYSRFVLESVRGGAA